MSPGAVEAGVPARYEVETDPRPPPVSLGVGEPQLSLSRLEVEEQAYVDPALRRLTRCLVDPTSVLLELRTELRALGHDVASSRADTLDERARVAEILREEAIERAREAARKASDYLDAGGFFGKLASGLACVAAVAAAVASGGVLGIAAAAIGAALVMGSEQITAVAVELGLPAEDAAYFKLGVEIAGGLLMASAGVLSPAQAAGAGAGASAGASSGAASRAALDLTRAAEIVTRVTEAAGGGAKVAAAGAKGLAAEANHTSRMRTIDAMAQERVADRATEDLAGVADEAAQIEAVGRRLAAIIRMSLRASEDARRAASSMLA